MFHVEHTSNQSRFLEYFCEGASSLGFSFSEKVLEKYWQYFQELNVWNRSVNLTGLNTEKEQAVLLFADSLFGSLALSENQSCSILDIGSGAGFPGIPMKLAFPSLEVTLLEPRGNKTAFLHNVIGKLGLTEVSVLQQRLENVSSFCRENEKWDLAISKAVSLEAILPHVRRILKKDGSLVVFRSSNIDNRDDLQSLTIDREIPYELPYEFGERVLSVLKLVP